MLVKPDEDERGRGSRALCPAACRGGSGVISHRRQTRGLSFASVQPSGGGRDANPVRVPSQRLPPGRVYGGPSRMGGDAGWEKKPGRQVSGRRRAGTPHQPCLWARSSFKPQFFPEDTQQAPQRITRVAKCDRWRDLVALVETPEIAAMCLTENAAVQLPPGLVRTSGAPQGPVAFPAP